MDSIVGFIASCDYDPIVLIGDDLVSCLVPWTLAEFESVLDRKLASLDKAPAGLRKSLTENMFLSTFEYAE